MKMICDLCGLNVDEISFHHLIPKTFHTNKRIRKMYDLNFLNNYGINLCKSCHKKIHSCISEKDLAYSFNSKELLLKNKEIFNFIFWRRKHPNFNDAISKKMKF